MVKGKPYEKIINQLSKYYDISNHDEFVPISTDLYRKILEVQLYHKDIKSPTLTWNMEDALKIKKIVMKFLPFEPLEDKYGYTWTGSNYDIEVSKADGWIQFNVRMK